MTKIDDVQIRPLVADDFEQWRGLWRQYLAHYDSGVSETIERSSFARMLSSDPHEYSGALAIHDGRAVGLVHYLFHRHGWKLENVCYLQDLFADARLRNRGIGRKLIEYVYDAADAAGAPDVYWMTQDFNQDARKLYDRIGSKTPFIKYIRA
ncbi:N-acetyltransferase family protein [Brevirhabdus sp.]|uniref:N-acetyltransferase family protein n=1 Tax=Brevirhabdus sp. TaxID=2004514 RepID=UPI00405948F0